VEQIKRVVRDDRDGEQRKRQLLRKLQLEPVQPTQVRQRVVERDALEDRVEIDFVFRVRAATELDVRRDAGLRPPGL
jgi:hypothetical protein